MKAIGGYFELELPQGKEYHKDAIRLNTGRNAFEYILRAKGYKKVYLPYYTCDVMLEPIKKLSLAFEFYHIDETFRPIFDFDRIKTQEAFVYNNYFGLCDIQVSKVAAKCKNLIVDNAQAFFSKPLPGVDTFYSPRKFFGLPDGAYLYTDTVLEKSIEQDVSYQRFEHLLGRIDLGAEEFYHSFKNNDKTLSNQPIRLMSNITRRLLKSIDYEWVKNRRCANFFHLHKELQKTNSINFELTDDFVPMVYPYLVKDGAKLRKQLIESKVFVASYWPNVYEWVASGSIEAKFAQNLLALPIDQRYNIEDMDFILSLIQKH